MKKWFVFALVLGVAGFAGAQDKEGGPGPGGNGTPPRMEKGQRPPRVITRKQFIAREKQMAERRGTKFDKAAAEAKFNALDKNKDGVLTGNERPKPPRDRRGPRGPITKKQFIAHQKMMAERQGKKFDPAAAEAKFNKLDKNKDGVLTRDELKMQRRQRMEGRKGDNDADEGSGEDDD